MIRPYIMRRYIAFLRAMNVGGRNVTNDVLRALFVAQGFADVSTFIASGNVIFTSPETDEAGLRAQIEAHLRAELGYEVITFLRTDAEVAAVAAYQPFDADRCAAAANLSVGFLAEPLSAESLAALAAFRSDTDDFAVHGREIYWISTVKQSETKITNAVLERKLKIRLTFRGVNTIARLTAKYPPAP